MPDLAPFRGIRFSEAEALAQLVCPPYDVISQEQEQALLESHPHNAVRLELAKSAAGGDPASAAARYRSAADAFAAWLDEGVLVQEDRPALYVYRQDLGENHPGRGRVAGVLGALALEKFGDTSGVLPHERTMEGPKKDRMALLEALGVNVSPIYAIYRGGGGLGPFLDDLQNRPPWARLADEEGILHRLWIITAPAEISMLADAIAATTLVIADGHHRYETALAYHEAHQGEGGEHDRILCLCVDADAEDLVVLPYHRIVDVPADGIRAWLQENARELPPENGAEGFATSDADHAFVFVADGAAFLVEVSDEEVVAAVGERHPAWRALDVVALHEVVLPALGLPADVTLRFTKDAEEVVSAAATGGSFGILLRALTAPQVVDVARSGERMPQKASYFWPKAVTGLVFRSLR